MKPLRVAPPEVPDAQVTLAMLGGAADVSVGRARGFGLWTSQHLRAKRLPVSLKNLASPNVKHW